MKTYMIESQDIEGEKCTQIVTAKNKSEAITISQEHGWYLVSIRPL